MGVLSVGVETRHALSLPLPSQNYFLKVYILKDMYISSYNSNNTDNPCPRQFFFIGKGGVGKSTSSALTSVHFSNMGYETLLVSMDPAHNQRDIFETEFSEKPRTVNSHLMVKEVDSEYWIRTYLKKTKEQIQDTYTYHSAFNLQHHFKVLKYAPGLEEYALMLAFEDIIRQHKQKDIIIFDMAPTALTLRFFSLPFITLIWLDELIQLRNHIHQKKEIITRIKLGRKEFERDRIKLKLDTLTQNYKMLRDMFLSETTHIHLVINEDQLSFSEAARIKQKLDEIGISLYRVIINKASQPNISPQIQSKFRKQKKTIFPLSSTPLVGEAALYKYIKANEDVFGELG